MHRILAILIGTIALTHAAPPIAASTPTKNELTLLRVHYAPQIRDTGTAVVNPTVNADEITASKTAEQINSLWAQDRERHTAQAPAPKMDYNVPVPEPKTFNDVIQRLISDGLLEPAEGRMFIAQNDVRPTELKIVVTNIAPYLLPDKNLTIMAVAYPREVKDMQAELQKALHNTVSLN